MKKRLLHEYLLWARTLAIGVVVVFCFRGRPPAAAQRGDTAGYAVPDVSHDGLVGTMTHQNDAIQTLAVAQDKQADQITRAFQRLSTVEANQMAETTELRIWGSLFSVLLGSGLIMQVSSRKRSGLIRRAAEKVLEATDGGGGDAG